MLNDGTDNAAWLAAREGKVTASKVAKIMTGGPGTWASLKRASTFRGNRYTKYGHEREPFIIDHLAQYGLVPNLALFGRADNHAHAATPDAISERGFRIGEAKTTVVDWNGLDSALESFRRNGIADYWWQIQWQLYVTDARACVFAYELHEDFIPVWPEPRIVIVERDDAAIAEALAQVATWQQFDADGIDAPEGLDDLLADRRFAKDAADAAAARAVAVEAEIRELMQQHGKPIRYEGPGVTVAWSGKPVSTTRFDSKRFQQAAPAVYQKFTKTTESQPRLTFTTPKARS